MDNSDVFAVLTACGGPLWHKTSKAFSHPHNVARYHKAAAPVTPESTASGPEPPPTRHASPADASVDCIILKFSDQVIDSTKGLQFGRTPATSDVLLQFPGVRGVSAQQFKFVVQEDQSWYLEDFTSSCGTTVDYDGKTKNERRQRERWIIAHPPNDRKQWKSLVVLVGDVEFNIDFPNQHREKWSTLRN